MEDLLDLQPGAELRGTQYRVIRRVGAGGMGAVFEIEHVRLKKRLVAKTLHPGLRSRDDFLARMETEAQTLARIAHPNIVAVHDLGVTSDGIPFFVMEKLDGCDLRRLLRTRRYLDLPDALMIVEDVLEALAHAHREGVVHRDIKPENIFLARDRAETVTKVLDFGIVKLMDDPRNLTGQRFLGTPQYASPEQLRGTAATEKTDLYAVGCMLFELITGQRPFQGPTPRDYMMQHLSHPPPRLASMAPNPPSIPSALDDLVASALEKDPAKRPTNALWFASQLHQLRQRMDKVELADAYTTEEMLLAGLDRGSSGRMRASTPLGGLRPPNPPSASAAPLHSAPSTSGSTKAPGDTVKDAAYETTQHQEVAGKGGTSPMNFRQAPTRTGAPHVGQPPTEQLAPSELARIDPAAAHQVASARSAKPSSNSNSPSDDRAFSDAGVSLTSSGLPRSHVKQWAIVGVPIAVSLVIATVILVRGLRTPDAPPSTPPPTAAAAATAPTATITPVAEPAAPSAPAASASSAEAPSAPTVKPALPRGASTTATATTTATASHPPAAATSAPKKDAPPPRDDLIRTF